MKALASLALLLFVGCSAAAAPASPTAVPVPTATPVPTPVGLSGECVTSLRPLYDALTDLDARLNIGLNKADYGTRVGDISVVYHRAGIASLTGDCLVLGAVPLEAAFNEFINANNAWGDCFKSTSCTNDTVKPKLQAFWLKAHEGLAKLAEAFAP